MFDFLKKKEPKSQAQRILDLLESPGEVSAIELSKISLRYGARIHDLKKKGLDIRHRSEIKKTKNGHITYTYYSLFKPLKISSN